MINRAQVKRTGENEIEIVAAKKSIVLTFDQARKVVMQLIELVGDGELMLRQEKAEYEVGGIG